MQRALRHSKERGSTKGGEICQKELALDPTYFWLCHFGGIHRATLNLSFFIYKIGRIITTYGCTEYLLGVQKNVPYYSGFTLPLLFIYLFLMMMMIFGCAGFIVAPASLVVAWAE